MDYKGKDQGAERMTVADPEDNKHMYYQEIHGVLKKAFQDTFVEELVPGIVHNFANPLNGVMGRSRLLQRRLTDIVSRDDAEKDAFYLESHKKMVRDVDSIAHEADRLVDLLQTVGEKFRAIGDRTSQNVNLSELIDMEMKFFDFYLDFKHSVKKTLQLDKELPDAKGPPADYSLAFSAIIRYAAVAMKNSVPKELHISTQLENGQICVKIRNRGVPISADLQKLLFDEAQGACSFLVGSVEEGLLCALSLLRKWGAGFDIKSDNGVNTISLLIPPFRGNNQVEA